jgi:hypothetical protein
MSLSAYVIHCAVNGCKASFSTAGGDIVPVESYPFPQHRIQLHQSAHIVNKLVK